MEQEPPRTKTGQFAPGVSGNAKGRPRRADSQALVPTAPAAPGGGGGDGRRRDGWINNATGHGTSRDRRTLTRYGVDIVTDIEALQLWRTELMAAKIIEDGPKLALSRGWHLKCEDKELDVAIVKQAEDLGMDAALRDAWMKANAYGGAAIFPVISGAQGELHTPLDEGAIASVDAFHVFEPQELTPAAYYHDIRSPHFRRPSAWRLSPLNSGRGGFTSTQIIHETRLVIFPGIRVSEQTQPGQREGWGDSILCRPRQVIADFGLAWGSAAHLLHGHGKETLELDGFEAMMAQADGLAEFDRHIEAMAMAWSTLRLNVIGAKSRISRATGTLAGVSELLSEFKSLMAAAANRPVSVLMGETGTGLRAGDEDTRTWYGTVEGDRSVVMLPRHERLVKLQLLATAGPAAGKEPDAWGVEYPSLWSPSEKEVAETRKTDMERGEIAINTGVASADDVAESFYKGDTYSGDIKIDWKRREEQAAIDAATPDEFTDEDMAAMGAEGEPVEETEEFSDEELDEMAEGDEEDDPDLEWDLDDEEDEDADDPEDEDRDDGEDDEWREDRGAAKPKAPGSRGPSRKVGNGGQGYNPYRTGDGKFGAGETKKPAGTGRAKASAEKKPAAPKVAKVAKPKREKFDDTSHRATVAGHKATEVKHRSEQARLKGEMAAIKAKAATLPPKQRGELKAQHAALKAQHDENKAAAGAARVERIAASKAMQAAKKEHTEKQKAGRVAPVEEKQTAPATQAPAPKATPAPKSPAPQSEASAEGAQVRRLVAGDAARRAEIAKPRTAPSTIRGETTPQFSAAAQRAIRDHHDTVLAHYGLTNLDKQTQGHHVVETSSKMKIGDAQVYGSHGQGGDIMLWSGVSDHLGRHARLSESELAGLGSRALSGDKEAIRMMDAYRVSTHEAAHGHGPRVQGNSRNGTMLDELSTEMVARKVVADVHGIGAHQVPGSYDRYIVPTVQAAADMSGKSYREAYDAMTASAFEFKRKPGSVDKQEWGSDHVEIMAASTLKKLGINDTSKHAELYRKLDDIDGEQRKYSALHPSPNRYL